MPSQFLEKMLRERDGKGMSTQPDEAPTTVQSPIAPQKIGINTPNKHPDPTRLIQIPIIMDLTTEDPQDVRFYDNAGYDKWIALEERLRAVEVNNLFDLVKAIEVCLVPKIMIL